MKKLFVALSLLFATTSIYAQEKVIELPSNNGGIGQLLFIPGFLTKDGQAIMYSQIDDWQNKVTTITVFDENFNVLKSVSIPNLDISYKKKEITFYRHMNDEHTEFTDDDWQEQGSGEVMDMVQNGSSLYGFQLHSDATNLGGNPLTLTQTLFDEDEEFEYLRPVYEVIPIDTKEKDYIAAHSTAEESSESTADEWWRQYGADHAYHYYESYYDQYMGWNLYKYENYGGIFLSGYEVVSLDGVVKKTINSSVGVNIYYLRGNLYTLSGSKGTTIYKLNSHKLPESTTYGPSFDLNRDGKVNAADHVTLSNKILGRE